MFLTGFMTREQGYIFVRGLVNIQLKYNSKKINMEISAEIKITFRQRIMILEMPYIIFCDMLECIFIPSLRNISVIFQ